MWFTIPNCRFRIIRPTEIRAIIRSHSVVHRQVRDQLRTELVELRQRLPADVAATAPGLAIVQVGGREDSNVYIRMKIRAAAEVGIDAQHIHLAGTCTQSELLAEIARLNDDRRVHGIIVQMPLDSVHAIDAHLVTDAVSPDKDVDGYVNVFFFRLYHLHKHVCYRLCCIPFSLHTINEGRIAVGDLTSGFLPCTPNGCLELIRSSGRRIAGSHAVVIGRSKIVGTPVAELLKWHDATVTVCHSRSVDVAAHTRRADIVVVAVGRPQMVRGDWIKPGAVVIDCGINSVAGELTFGDRLLTFGDRSLRSLQVSNKM